jgi:hypothetical protein
MSTIANAARLPVAAARKNVKKSPPIDNLNTTVPPWPIDKKTLVLRVVMHAGHLLKRDSPACAVIAPETYDRRRLLFLPRIRSPIVLLI